MNLQLPWVWGSDPFNQNFWKLPSKTEWIGSVQTEKFRESGSTFRGGPLFWVGPVRSKLTVPLNLFDPFIAVGFFPSLLIVHPCVVTTVTYLCFEVYYVLAVKNGLFLERLSNILFVIQKWCLKIFQLINQQISRNSLLNIIR